MDNAFSQFPTEYQVGTVNYSFPEEPLQFNYTQGNAYWPGTDNYGRTVHAPVPLPCHYPLPQALVPSQNPLTEYEVSYSAVEQHADHWAPDSYYFSNISTFPTPSQLLTEVHAKEAAATRPRTSPSRSTTTKDSEKKSESQRKARHREMAESIGFQPTDPDTISCHEKKRHFLESLENYVLYLREQLRLVNTEPIRIERISTYRGLTSASMRTLLVHMEDVIRKRHQQTMDEERNFLRLCEQVMDQEDDVVVDGINDGPSFAPA